MTNIRLFSFSQFLRQLLGHFIDLTTAAGQILRTVTAPFHFSFCTSTPCTCNWPDGLSATYTVSGWEALAPCSTCDASSAPAWTGVMNHIGAGCSWWAADPEYDPLSISGSMLDILYTQVFLRTGTTPCRWELYIACTSVTSPTKTMWFGVKLGGDTPVGTYTFVSSECGDSIPTMMVS